MSVAKVLKLDDYRDRRAQRLRLAAALHRVEPFRHAIHAHLVGIAELSGADRVATVWVDEYGSGLIHPHVVLDPLFEKPRRQFSADPLHEAWELGIPSAHDRTASSSSAPATLAVALGSDGTRAWFVVAESMFARPSLDASVRDRIMFLAGECAAVVLHRDLDSAARRGGMSQAKTFAGWPILEDLESREEDESVSARIAGRFIVGRLVRMLVDDDLAVAPERMADQVRRARAELAKGDPDADARDEALLWQGVLDALEGASFDTLAPLVVQLGDMVEAQGHTNGARELYRCGYEIAAGIAAARPAVDAARYLGRMERRNAAWEEARRWFEVARGIAEVADMPGLASHALVGLAGIKKETGNLPAARETFREALKWAEGSRDRDAIALVHHGLLGLEQVAGNLVEALQHGWLAVASYEDERGRTRCLASLAGALIQLGDREAAEDAWTVVAHSSPETYYRVYAEDALAHLAALRGDTRSFEAHAARCDALGWESGAHVAKAEILYYRGLSYRALGRHEQAHEWLTRALAFAEEHKFGRILFMAEEALRAEDVRLQGSRRAPAPAAPPELREGLRTMRQELATVGA